MEVYSRTIIGWEVHERETCEAAGCVNRPLVLHSDNGLPMKGATLLETLRRLEVEPSYSRPRVSNDNAFFEALFRACKYVPDFHVEGFGPSRHPESGLRRS